MKKLILLFILTPFVLKGQIVNIENKRFNDTTKFEGKISSRINFMKSASVVTDIGNNIVLQYQTKLHRVILSNDVNLLKISNTPTTVNSGYSHIRYQRKLTNLLSLEEFVQYQYNKPLKINERYLIGSGIRFKTKLKQHKATSGVAIMYELENKKSTIRTNFYTSMYLTFNNINISNILYYQPAFKAVSNYRILDEMQFQFNISKKIGYALVIQYAEDSEHAEGIPRLTYKILNQLSYIF